MKYIALDSGPLRLITHNAGVAEADACRRWFQAKSAQGISGIICEIIDYERGRWENETP
jgi:hypothetical protein